MGSSALVKLLRDGTLEEVKDYVKRHPESATARDEETGRLALHDVLDDSEAVHADDEDDDRDDAAYFGVTCEKIAFLLEANPGIIVEKDNNGQLPLHVAALAKVHCPDKLHLLLNYFPGATKIRDCDGLLPLELAMDEKNFDAVSMLIRRHIGRFYNDGDEQIEGPSILERALRKNAPTGSIRMLVRMVPECLKMKDKFGNLPLHSALLYDSTSEEVQLIMDAYPGALEVPDSHGELPLHIEVSREDPRLELLRTMIENYSKALSKTNAIGQLPFHLLVMDKDVLSAVLRLLYDAYPQCLSAVDCGGRSPLHACLAASYVPRETICWLARKAPVLLQAADNDGNLPLHLAAENSCCSLDILEFLGERFPRALQVQGGPQGDLPLHRAMDMGRPLCKRDIESVEYLLNRFPEGAAQTNSHGQLPLHVACGSGHIYCGYRCRNCCRRIEAVCRFCSPGVIELMEVFELLVSRNPGGLAVYDNKGFLPFHLACKKANHVSLVEHFIKKVEGPNLPATKDGTPPLFLACEQKLNLDVIFLLVQHSRELFHGNFHSPPSDGSPVELARAWNSRKRCKTTNEFCF